MRNATLRIFGKRFSCRYGSFSLLTTVPFLLSLPFFCWMIVYTILMDADHSIVQEIQQQVLITSSVIFDNDHITQTTLKSDKRGYVALLYSGTARSFSANFESHIVNLMAGCPYTVHLFLHTYTNENHPSKQSGRSRDKNYPSVNTTLAYYEGYMNLDNERVLFRDAVKANVFEYVPLGTLRAMYKDTYHVSMRRFPPHPPISSIYYMWHSQRRSEELRQNYIDETDINYKWTFRMRHDGVYYTNWWQRAFDVTVYNPLNPVHKNITHDVFRDWGIRRTRLHDMVYEPRLTMDNVLYTPFGWSYGGYNDQFAAMSSLNANHYFMRILHVDRMLREKIVHPETSIRLIVQWNQMNVDNSNATICYDVVRIPMNNQQHTNSQRLQNRSCSYKRSGDEDCKILCPQMEKINSVLRDSFIHNSSFLRQNMTKIQGLLDNYLSRMKDAGIEVDHQCSSFYYFYRYMSSDNVSDPCLPHTWTIDQGNNYQSHHFPFILRSSDQRIIAEYNQFLTCGSPVNSTI